MDLGDKNSTKAHEGAAKTHTEWGRLGGKKPFEMKVGIFEHNYQQNLKLNLDRKWFENYDHLVEYKNKHGTLRVPRKLNDPKPGLGKWVYEQRHAYSKGKMSEERIEILGSLGFQWQLVEHNDWIEKIAGILSYDTQRIDHCTTRIRKIQAVGNFDAYTTPIIFQEQALGRENRHP